MVDITIDVSLSDLTAMFVLHLEYFNSVVYLHEDSGDVNMRVETSCRLSESMRKKFTKLINCFRVCLSSLD